jgi:hypothetical protein
MHKTWSIAALILALSDTGCYHHRVLASKGNSATSYATKNVYSLFWGLAKKPNIDVSHQDGAATQPPGTCESNAINEVRVTSNLGYAAVTVLTLGIYSPLKVQWMCATEPPPRPRPIGAPEDAHAVR